MFRCDRCGLCCQSIGNSEIYHKLDRGDGTCQFFDEESRLCKIYSKRPLMCNVDKLYEVFFEKVMTKDEYYNLNYEACKKIKKEWEKDHVLDKTK